MWLELTKAIAQINIPADWLGIRVVKETSSTCYVRDGIPESNGKSSTMGFMLEVMISGCMGYAATNSLAIQDLQAAAQKAYRQALAASEWWIHPFEVENERPKVVGQY